SYSRAITGLLPKTNWMGQRHNCCSVSEKCVYDARQALSLEEMVRPILSQLGKKYNGVAT
ncbi:hypothetical protein RZS08_50205, partial [Arthrospira platensis SPKY1]|nr:hypothetical protein [Arthrospira platensis SPKY1]